MQTNIHQCSETAQASVFSDYQQIHEAGVPNRFKAYSVRSAATSKAAGLSSCRTLDKFYNKPLHCAEATSTADGSDKTPCCWCC